MDSNLLSCGRLEIPEALTLDHDKLRAELIRAAMIPGPIGKAAERVAELCLTHFVQEEENILRAFALLHDLASDRLRPDTKSMARMIAQFSGQHLALRNQHQTIGAAVEELLLEARKEENKHIVELIANLRDHEKIEDQVMYPTALLIGRSARESVGV